MGQRRGKFYEEDTCRFPPHRSTFPIVYSLFQVSLRLDFISFGYPRDPIEMKSTRAQPFIAHVLRSLTSLSLMVYKNIGNFEYYLLLSGYRIVRFA